MKNRYVLVAVDKTSGHIYISNNMLKDVYSKKEVEEVIELTSDSLKKLRKFYVMPYSQALGLWMEELEIEHINKNKRLLH